MRVCRAFAEELIKAVEHRHRRISHHFGSDCGAGFERLDYDMAIQVMMRMIEKTGRCPLPLHDSFLVADIDANALHTTMNQVAREEGSSSGPQGKESNSTGRPVDDHQKPDHEGLPRVSGRARQSPSRSARRTRDRTG